MLSRRLWVFIFGVFLICNISKADDDTEAKDDIKTTDEAVDLKPIVEAVDETNKAEVVDKPKVEAVDETNEAEVVDKPKVKAVDETNEAEVKEPDDPEREDFVYTLTGDNFDSFVEGKDTVLLQFYAPWCGHCKAFAGTYKKIAEELDGKVDVAKIDATQENSKALGKRFGVTGYPSIKILKNQKPIDYKGDRTKDAVIKKVNELSDPNWAPPPEAVITLTKSNFRTVVDNADIILVEFYAPWCGHCKKLAPEYESAAQVLQTETPPILLAKVDATQESELAQEFDVTGYPTMKLFRRGRAYEYTGGRDENGIIQFMIEQNKPPSTEVKSLKSMKNILHIASDVTIIGCFKGEDDPALAIYQEAGNSLRSEYDFHHAFDKEVLSGIGASVGEVVLFHPERFHSKYEEKKYKLKITDEVTKKTLEDFLSSHSCPLVGERTNANKEKRYSKRPLVVVYYGVDFSFDYRKATQIIRNKVVNVAHDFPYVNFAIAKEDDFTAELKRVKLDDSPEEVNVIIYDENENRYPMEPEEDFDEDLLSDFVNKFIKGKLKPMFKSAKKPKKNTGSVKTVVADTFNEIVMDDSKDTMIEFYAPWCGHCKKLAPVYKQLGKKLKNNDKVVIAKMDATANDIPHIKYKSEGFPTIYWSPAGDSANPKIYEGGRDIDSLLEYVEKHLSSRSKDEL